MCVKFPPVAALPTTKNSGNDTDHKQTKKFIPSAQIVYYAAFFSIYSPSHCLLHFPVLYFASSLQQSFLQYRQIQKAIPAKFRVAFGIVHNISNCCVFIPRFLAERTLINTKFRNAKLKARQSFEMSGKKYPATQCHIPEE
jgi:hypothetical protein